MPEETRRGLHPRLFAGAGLAKEDLAPLLLLIVTCLVTYWVFLPFLGFYLDDFGLIRVFRIHGYPRSVTLSTQALFKSHARLGPIPYAVGFTLFKLFGWQSALPHHIFFHCVHIVNSFMVYLLVRGLVRSRTAATLAMVFFAVLPFRSQAVYWFSGGITAVTFTFLMLVSLLALLRFVREGRWRWWGLSFAFFLLAFFASEVILPLLAIFVLAPWLGPDRPRAKRARQVALGLVPFLGVGLAYIPVKLFVLPKSSYLAIGDKLNWLNLVLNVNDLLGLGAIYKLRRGLVDLQNTPMLGLLLAVIGAALGAALIFVVRRRPAPPAEPKAPVWPSAAKLGALGVLFILCNYCVFVLADRLYIGTHHHYVASLGGGLLAAGLLSIPLRMRGSRPALRLAGGGLTLLLVVVCYLGNCIDARWWVRTNHYQTRAREELAGYFDTVQDGDVVVFEGFPRIIGTCPSAFYGKRAMEVALYTWFGKEVTAPVAALPQLDGFTMQHPLHAVEPIDSFDNVRFFTAHNGLPVLREGIRFHSQEQGMVEVELSGPRLGTGYYEYAHPYKTVNELPDGPHTVHLNATYPNGLELLAVSIARETDCETRVRLYWRADTIPTPDTQVLVRGRDRRGWIRFSFVRPLMEGLPPGEWNQGEIVVQTFVWARNIWYSGQNPVPEGEYTAEIAMFCQGVVTPTVTGPHVRLDQGALFFQILVAAVLPPTARHDTPGAEQ